VRLEEHGATVMVLEKKTSESKSQGCVTVGPTQHVDGGDTEVYHAILDLWS
jgi:hypothetical protein